MQFELPKDKSSIIKVIGVGGGGSNAVNHMYKLGIKGVDFVVCNTDAQALDISPVPNKIQLGPNLTEGRGAGSIPEVGKQSAIENLEEMKQLLLDNTKMVFITAGLGGGTGTGAAPIIAGLAKDMGILTVGIVTVPFTFEGKKRKLQAEQGIKELKENVDTLLIICNDRLREIHGDLKLREAFGKADDVLTVAAKSIAEIITVTGYINVDFADVQTVMKQSGVAIMGSAMVEGEERAIRAAQHALDSPLLNDNNIVGARYILINVSSGDHEVTMDEIGQITDFIQEQAGATAEVIMGTGIDEELDKKVAVTIIATGFNAAEEVKQDPNMDEKGRIVRHLEDKVEVTPITETDTPPFTSEEDIEIEMVKKEVPIQKELYFDLNTDEGFELDKQNNQAPIKDEVEDIEENTQELNETPEMRMELDSDMEIEEEIESDIEFETPTQEDFEFEVTNIELKETEEEPVVTNLNDEVEEEENEEEDQFARARNRIRKLKELSIRVSDPKEIAEMEREPAYKRQNIRLENTPPAEESNISRFTLSEDKDQRTEIKPNNSFLHDKVD